MIVRTHRYQLLFSFLAVALIPVCCLIGYQSWLLYGEMRKAEERQRVSTQQIAAQIEAFVEMHRRSIEAAADQITQSGNRNKAGLDSVLSALYRQFPGFLNMYFADKRARTLAFYPEYNARGESMVGADFSFREHFKNLLKEPKTYISPVLKGIGGTEKLLCTIVAPYFDKSGQFDGFVLGALDLEKIGTIINQAKLDEHIYAVVTDDKGQAIFAPGWSSMSHPEVIDIQTIVESEPVVGQIRLIRHHSLLTHQPVVTTVAVLNEPKWFVWLSIPQDAEEAIFRQWLVSSANLVLAVIFLVFVLSNAISGKLSLALEVLNTKANFLQKHEYQKAHELALSASAPAEIQALDLTFENMAYSVERARTELLAANTQLDNRVKERTATLAAAIESMRDGFGLMDREGVFTLVNQRFRDFVGSSETNEPLTRKLFLAALQRRNSVHADALSRVLVEPNTGYEFVESEEKVWLLLTFHVRDENALIGMGVVVRDITEAHKLDVMKNSLISVAAHEFKTPLASMRMQAETLARRDVKWTKQMQTELIDGLVEDIERLQTLVGDWLDLSRIEAGALVLRRKKIRCSAVIEQARKIAASQADFSSHIETGAEEVFADAGRLQQILVNLFANAVRYCDTKPQISVVVSRRDSLVSFAVTDNGIGIDPESQDRIFEKFHQVDMSMTRRAGGTGLGLTISRGLARAHGGDITVESSLGKGSTFTVSIREQR